MKTRTEELNGFIYCAYCGNTLRSPHILVSPAPQLICNCEDAKQELELYDKLRELYYKPIAESLIELKVDDFRASLMGKHNSNSYTYSDGVLNNLGLEGYLHCTSAVTEDSNSINSYAGGIDNE